MLYRIKDSKSEEPYTSRVKLHVIRNGVQIPDAIPEIGDLLSKKCRLYCHKGASCPNIHELVVVEYVKVIIQ